MALRDCYVTSVATRWTSWRLVTPGHNNITGQTLIKFKKSPELFCSIACDLSA